MLTEREWLEDREYASYHYSCQWCSQYDPMLIMPDRQNVPCMWYATCPCNTNNYDYKDALEFSERVTAKLAELFASISLSSNATEFDCESSCPAFSVCCTLLHEGMPCDDAILMYARLAVEEEMDENS